MISLKKYYLNTTEGVDCIPVTHEVHYAIRDAAAQEGLVTILVPHPGAGIVLGEQIPEVMTAITTQLQQWNATSEADGEITDARGQPVDLPSRIMSTLMGRSLTLPFAEGKLCHNPYSDCLVIDADPQSTRREILIQIFGDTPPSEGQQSPEEAYAE
jgi:thiamine phosphate synthase YjbQ (UPF0047 family)